MSYGIAFTTGDPRDDLKHQWLDPDAKLFKLPQIKVRSFGSEATTNANRHYKGKVSCSFSFCSFLTYFLILELSGQLQSTL